MIFRNYFIRLYMTVSVIMALFQNLSLLLISDAIFTEMGGIFLGAIPTAYANEQQEPTPGPCLGDACTPVPRDENDSSISVGDFLYLGWASVGECAPYGCPEFDVENVIGVMAAQVWATPTPAPPGTPTPTPVYYNVLKEAEDEDYWFTGMGGQSSAAATAAATQLIRKDVSGTTMITGLIASLTGDPEGCPKYRTDTQTPRSRGYVYVFGVELSTTPNGEGGLDITYSISEPSFNVSYPPCQAPFAHEVDIDITDNNGHYAHASDTETLSGWSDTWGWDGHFSVGNLDWNQSDSIEISVWGEVAGFKACYIGSYPPDCVTCDQIDASFYQSLDYPLPTPTFTNTPTFTLTPTATSTPTLSSTLTSTSTPTSTQTPTDTLTPTETNTPTGTLTPTFTGTLTGTVTPTSTQTPTATRTPTATQTPTSTRTPTFTSTPSATATPVYTSCPWCTSTNTFTNTPTYTNTASFTPTRSYTGTPVYTPTHTHTPTNTHTPSSDCDPYTSSGPYCVRSNAFSGEDIANYDFNPETVAECIRDLHYNCDNVANDITTYEAIQYAHVSGNRIYYIMAHGNRPNGLCNGVSFGDGVMVPSDINGSYVSYKLVFLNGCYTMENSSLNAEWASHFNTKVLMGWIGNGQRSIQSQEASDFSHWFFEALKRNDPQQEPIKVIDAINSVFANHFKSNNVIRNIICVYKGQNEVIERH